MIPASSSALQVRARANAVKEYHYDDARPGKPLNLLIPGGLIALAAIGLIIFIIYQTWFNHSMHVSQAKPMLLLLAPFYIGGVYMFSYGYELYDQKKALRLTAIIVFVTVAFVVIIAVLFALMNAKKDESKSDDKSSSSGDNVKSGYASTAATSSGGFGSTLPASLAGTANKNFVNPIFFVDGNSRTVTETREVIKEVPMAPLSIACPACDRSYVPAENNFACPYCSAPAPKSLLEPPQAPSA